MIDYTKNYNSINKNRENTLYYDFTDIKNKSEDPKEHYLGPKIKYSDLSKNDLNCVPIAHYYDDNHNLQVVFSREPTHSLGIGCTGAGKTTSLIIPKVHIMSCLKTKPSFFIIDAKGELHNKLSGHLKKQGYTIKVIDLNEPEFSPSWNPFSDLYDKYVEAYKLASSVVEHNDDIESYPHLKKMSFSNKCTTWYELKGCAYSSLITINKAIVHMREKLLSEVSEDVRDLGFMIIKTQKKDDPHWDDTARDLFIAVVMGLLERSVIDSKNALTRDQFNLRTICNALISNRDDELRTFIENSDKNLDAYRYANKIVNMKAEITKSCYFGTLSTQLSQFKSYPIQKVTLKNTIELSTLVDEPEAIFLKMDDLKQSNYCLAQLIIIRLYQSLKKKAQMEENLSLKRPVHFILDEFGNFPPFNDFGNMISVSRSYNIWYTMIIQSYSQLNMKYGEDVAKIIIENSNMQLFFGTNDFLTKKNFSEACGSITRISENAYLDGNKPMIENYPIEAFKTVPVSELSRIETSEVYITCFRMPVMFSHMERYYLVKEFTPLPKVEYRVLDDIEVASKKYNYDISFDVDTKTLAKKWNLRYLPKINVENIDKSINQVDFIYNSLIKANTTLLDIKKIDWSDELWMYVPKYISEGINKYKMEYLTKLDPFSFRNPVYKEYTKLEEKNFYDLLKLDIIKNIFKYLYKFTKKDHIYKMKEIVNGIVNMIGDLMPADFIVLI